MVTCRTSVRSNTPRRVDLSNEWGALEAGRTKLAKKSRKRNSDHPGQVTLFGEQLGKPQNIEYRTAES